MSYLYPISFMLNTFATTALMVGLGLAGKSVMAAEVGIVQGATMALFYTFSANARNIIVNPSSQMSVRSILISRLLLCAPLGIVAFYLSVYIANVGLALALVIILRRCIEWIGELHLSDMEIRGQHQFARRFIVVQSILLFLALGWTLGDTSMPFLGLFLWAILPLVMSLGFLHEQLTARGQFEEAWIQMLPHLGSTAMIGITVYVFRLLILLIVGKETAGELYTAFAIGGMLGSVFAIALGPSLVLHETRTGEAYLPTVFKTFMWLWLCGGAILFVISQFGYEALMWTMKSKMFWGAVGLSMVGGVVMVFAQRIRLRLLQVSDNDDVYGPDVLMNIIILASVPCLYYVVGINALMTLYLLSSTVAFLFYYSGKLQSPVSERRFGLPVDTWKKIIVFLLIFPLFFQVTGNIFHDSALIFDSGGSLKYVPLPLSLFACYLGIPLLGRYKRAYISLGVIFLSFVLMLMTTVVSTHGEIIGGQGKIILLLQFIVPMGGLVLGQIYDGGNGDPFNFEKISLYVLLALIPVQLLCTWIQGHLLLSPYLYIFSIYQHVQYVPVIFVGIFLITLYSLGDLPEYKRKLLVLFPLMGIYVAASTSMLAMLALIGGMIGFIVYRWKYVNKRPLITCVVLVCFTLGGYLFIATNRTENTEGMFAKKFGWSTKLGLINSDFEETLKLMPTIEVRLYYWKYYWKGIVNDYTSFLFGHPKRPERSEYPSAHNYYLDFVYNFGILAILPLLTIIGYTVMLVYRHRQSILSSSGLLGLTLVVLFLLFVDNGMKVGLRQPYPGVLSFFLWGVLVSKLSQVTPPMHSGKGGVSRR